MHFTAISNSGYLSYLERETTERAYWNGKAAEKLGIAGAEVTKENWKLLCDGIDPVCGEVLRTRERHSLSDGKRQYAWPVLLYDGTFPAAKSVSVMAMVDERISRAHFESVRECLPVMESLASCRSGRSRELVRTSNAVYAVFEHHANRELEPHEHAHIATINLTFDSRSGEWRALAAYDMYRAGTPIQERYREILAERVAQLGYGIVPRVDREGWEVEGVTRAIMEKFSQRVAQRDEAMEAFSVHHGRNPSPNETAILVRNHRAEKQYLPVEEVRERQWAQLAPAERESLHVVAERAQESERIRLPQLQDQVEHESPAQIRRFHYGKESQKERPGVYS
jgi:conjugative relaxase-like TrwC/TraI family protein